MTFSGFDQRFYEFFDELSQNNERPWFQENKKRYEAVVVKPTQDFIQAMAPHLEKISPHFVADPRRVGGSMFRIYRDTRFSKDKTPYKTHTGVQFRHALGKDAHCPGFYFHISPREHFLACGIWHPDGPTRAAIRKYIDEHPQKWLEARDDVHFKKHWELRGDALKRNPKGYSVDHPLIDDLKRKDFIAVLDLPPMALFRENLIEDTARLYAAATPLMRFLCKATGVPF